MLADQYILTHRSDWGNVFSAGGSRDSAVGRGFLSAGSVRPEVKVTDLCEREKLRHFCHT